MKFSHGLAPQIFDAIRQHKLGHELRRRVVAVPVRAIALGAAVADLGHGIEFVRHCGEERRGRKRKCCR
jgi:hypothetical protein